jgi:hypothetical protein
MTMSTLSSTSTNQAAEQATLGPDNAACGPRALCGWSPPPLPADTTFKRRIDRIVVGNVPAVVALALVVGLLNLAPHLPIRANLAITGLGALAAGAWCSLNFWRCRHAHCLITGVGWLTLAAFAFVEAGIGRSLIHGDEQVVFLAVFAAGLLFECGWYLRRRTNAVTGPYAHHGSPSPGRPSGPAERKTAYPKDGHATGPKRPERPAPKGSAGR